MKNKIYAVQYRRKRAGKTDYRKRLKLLMPGKPRLVLRKTLHNFIVQIAQYEPNGDTIVTGAGSAGLKKYGWNYSGNSVSAAYLTGLIAGMKAKESGIKEAVADIGLQNSKKGARVYAALKGFADSGIKIPYSEEIMPEQSRIEGKHIEQYAKILKENPEAYKKQFSGYIKKGLNPEKISEDFKKTKEAIMRSSSKAESKV